MTAQQAGRISRVVKGGQLACLAWLVATVARVVLAEPAMADNCTVFTDCFRQANSAAEATFGLALLAGLSLLLDFVPIVGDVKGIVEGVTGRDVLTGEELSPLERALGMIPLLPATDALRALGKLDGVTDLGRQSDGGLDVVASLGRHGDDAGDAAGAGRHADDGVPRPQPGGEPPRRGGGGDQPPRRGGADDRPPRDDEPNSSSAADTESARLDELARDPAHGGRITEGSMQEARVAKGLDESGRLPGLERDPSGAADFIDTTGQAWDVKGFNSAYSNGYDLDSAMIKIDDSLASNENVILDTTKMSQADIDELRGAVEGRADWVDKIVWWP